MSLLLVMGTMSNVHHNLIVNYIVAILVRIVHDAPYILQNLTFVQQVGSSQLEFEISYIYEEKKNHIFEGMSDLKHRRDNLYESWKSHIQKLPQVYESIAE